jgi:glycosyltransferase involved in cell wall biosynthesis
VRVPQCYTQTSIAYFDRFLQRCVQTAKIIVADSQATRQDILEYTDVDEAKVRVVHLGVDTYGGTPLSPSCIEETKARYGLHAAYFLMLGETCRRKNIPLALDAIQDIKQRRKDCPTLVLVGKSGDDADRIAGLIRDKGIEDQVRWLGHVPEGDVYPLLAGAIALLYPSLYEGFGLPPLQAMQVGTPVIASSVSSIPEVVGDAGLLMDPTCSGTLTEAMLTVLDDESLRRQLTIRGRLRVRQFTWEKTARSMVAAYEDALS